MKKKRNIEEDRFFQFFFFIFFFIFIAFLVFSNFQIEKRKAELAKQVNSLRSKILELEERKKNLEEALSQTQKESYWEELAREEGYVKEGEEVIVVKKVESEKEKTSENSFFKIWQGIKSFFKK